MIEPVAIPGTAAGTTWRQTVCQGLAPRAKRPVPDIPGNRAKRLAGSR